jgi:large subunit ribosomal protein L18
MALNKLARRKRIHNRIRKKMEGTTARPRLSVYRSNKQIYCQLIDDQTGVTWLLPHPR